MLLFGSHGVHENTLYYKSTLDTAVTEKCMEELRKTSYREVTVMTTAYTMGDNYTPSTIMANGEVPHVGAVAYNRVPLGTTLIIDGNTYVVKDRAWDDDVVDIYMDTYDDCVSYGVKEKTVKIKEEI